MLSPRRCWPSPPTCAGTAPLASVALEQAESACPGNRLAVLLRTALDAGLPPQRLEAMAVRAARGDWQPESYPGGEAP